MTTMSDTMDANAGTTTLTHRWGWLLAFGIVQIIAGTIAFAIPIVASFAAVAIFGAVLLVTATFQLIHAFKIGAWRRSAWYGLSGALYAIAGLLLISMSREAQCRARALRSLSRTLTWTPTMCPLRPSWVHRAPPTMRPKPDGYDVPLSPEL
jgi:uncharacterized membrane protein HdeD (DUF308 family)